MEAQHLERPLQLQNQAQEPTSFADTKPTSTHTHTHTHCLSHALRLRSLSPCSLARRRRLRRAYLTCAYDVAPPCKHPPPSMAPGRAMAVQVTNSLPLSLREEVLYEMHKDLLLKACAP